MTTAIAKIVLHLLVPAGILTCTAAVLCETHLRFVRASQEGLATNICTAWASWTDTLFLWKEQVAVSGTISHRVNTTGLWMFGVAFPFFFGASLNYMLSLCLSQKITIGGRGPAGKEPRTPKPVTSKNSGRGSHAVHFWSFVVLCFPSIIICSDIILHNPGRTFVEYLEILANPFGVAAVIALAFFLVPVARGSKTTEWNAGHQTGWSPIDALVFHRWAGWSCSFWALLHGGLWCLEFYFRGHAHGKNISRSLWDSLVPPMACWSWPVPFFSYLQFKDDPENNQCYEVWLNFTGFISALALFTLAMSSWSIFRRRFYSIFYKTHVIAGSIMLLFAILHFGTVLMYLFPSIMYYLSTTIPTMVHQWLTWRKGGVKVSGITPIKDSGGCCEVAMRVSSHVYLPHEDAAYARICVPGISMIWHPFSVIIQPKRERGCSTSKKSGSINTTDTFHDEEEGPGDSVRQDEIADLQEDSDYEMVILFRPVGQFTKTFAQSLQPPTASDDPDGADELRSKEKSQSQSTSDISSPWPTILVDGFYNGAFPIQQILDSHDRIVIVAGGVGIVPFVTLLQTWHRQRTERARCGAQLGGDAATAATNPVDHDPDGGPEHPDGGPEQQVVVFWSCRESGLVDHVLKNYLAGLWRHNGDCHSPPEYSSPSSVVHLTIHCHITSEDAPVPSFFISPRDGSAERNGEAHVTVTNALDRSSGSPLEPARFDLTSLSVFLCVIWSSFFAQLWIYTRRIDEYRVTTVRGNAVYLGLFLSVMLGFAGERCRSWHRRHVAGWQRLRSLDDDDDDDQPDHAKHITTHEESAVASLTMSLTCLPTISTTDEGKDLTGPPQEFETTDSAQTAEGGFSSSSPFNQEPLPSLLPTPLFQRSEAGNVLVDYQRGRPDVETFFLEMTQRLEHHRTTTTTAPPRQCYSALLLCGPKPLRDGAKRGLRSATSRHRRTKWSIYEEISEM